MHESRGNLSRRRWQSKAPPSLVSTPYLASTPEQRAELLSAYFDLMGHALDANRPIRPAFLRQLHALYGEVQEDRAAASCDIPEATVFGVIVDRLLLRVSALEGRMDMLSDSGERAAT